MKTCLVTILFVAVFIVASPVLENEVNHGKQRRKQN